MLTGRLLASIGTDFIRRSRWYSANPKSSERDSLPTRSSGIAIAPASTMSAIARSAR